MASIQQPEVLLAQRLASNEKPVRTKALRKLKKYISAREGAAGGLSAEELLKLWKGLFYCVWMQDKPLLQEELSSQISNLIHSFQNPHKQLLYLQSFLETMKREWTGIDRLRMDKFFQLIRFMFRQTFEALKRSSWESGAVTGFLELLGSQLLQSDSGAPSGLQLHVLELYLTELAAVGSAELTADQNLTFIDPFCRTVAKTKNQMLFGAICSRIFSPIIDQAPFAVEDLMREVSQAEDSEEDEGGQETQSGRSRGKLVNGKGSSDGVDEEEELLHSELDSQLSGDEDIGPVLQFDYAAVADRILELAGRGNTPGRNRQKLYRIVKVLKDLSEGVFPQDEYPEEVSTDEDDDMFGSRKRMKRGARPDRGKDEPAPGPKKSSKPGSDASNKSEEPSKDAGKKKKKKKKKRKKEVLGDKANSEDPTAAEPVDGPEGSLEAEPADEAEPAEEAVQELQLTSAPAETENLSEEDGSLKKKRRRRKRRSKNKVLEVETNLEVSAEETSEPPESKDEPTNKTKKKKTRAGCEAPVNGSPASDVAAGGEDSSEDGPKRRKRSQSAEEGSQQETAGASQQTTDASADTKPPESGNSAPLKKRRKRRKAPADEEVGGDAESLQADDEKTEVTMATPTKKKKMNGLQSQTSEETGLRVEMTPADRQEVKKKKKKKIIPVEFEFEVDEMKEEAESAGGSGEMDAKKHQQVKVQRAADPGSPLKTGTGSGSGSDFVSFKTRTVVPKPLFCKTRTGQVTPLSKKKKKKPARSELKKVTFGLTNNQTAEFRKSDRSSLLSPDGSSRVPFDPEQKPKFGVLKTPPTTPKTSKRRSKTKISSTPKSTPKRRPLASDFF
ncbi:ribosomal RNA processing protein 1 homolog A isoform X1 [Oryzias melastigma]|uniref:Ribosomal RNA processing protein 1 homolog A-like n=1 Tax=Oryzias melastigma TaxID=30732 RepID=A0A3B3CE61_ORYME|nr:ribosomal RNA processing protein 1 homolog A isoform X1 [Oryzias melastigma]